MTPRKETPIATRQAVINMRENGMRGTEIAMDLIDTTDAYSSRRPSFPRHNNDINGSRDFKAKEDRQIVAGIPDLNDPCFRRYESSIIVNAQPYERRSSIGLIRCKSHCLSSQSGVYNCRSFVYDNVNQVCDLFAHAGDQPPARLLRFQTRDYFEPTNDVRCLNLAKPYDDSNNMLSPEPSKDHSVDLTPNQSNLEDSDEDSSPAPPPETTFNEQSTTAESAGEKCPPGHVIRYLKTDGFELFNNDDEQMTSSDPVECAKACSSNIVNRKTIDCKSFDYDRSTSTCSFTSEAAVPLGNGQMKQKESTSYNEKICVDAQLANQCQFYARHPQMILVGFTESVSDSSSIEHCFNLCMNSQRLFGFNCTSGMFYFEETQLNCILNSENRRTQPELFTDEETDVVDYFEVECAESTSLRRAAGVKNFAMDPIDADKMRSTNYHLDEMLTARWGEWSDCIDGKQTRHRSCVNFNKIENCAEDTRDCVPSETIPTKQEIAEVKSKIRREGFKCPLNRCCRVFDSCTFGLRHNSYTKQLEWCKRPCESERARLL